MDFLFINNFVTEVEPLTEVIAVKNTVILGEKSYVVSFHIIPLNLILYSDRMPDKKVIESYPKYFAQSPGITVEGVDNFYADLLFFRNRKNRNQQELMILGGLEKKMKLMRADVKMYYELHCNYYKIMCLKEFVVSKDLLIYTFYLPQSVTEDQLFPDILNEFVDTDKMCYFDETILNHAQEISINDANIPYLNYEDKIIFHLPLFTIPGLDTLNYNQFKMIKSEMNDLLKDFYTAVEGLEKELYFLSFDAKNIVVIQEKINETIVPIVNDIKEKVEGNMYFQQIINSIESPPLSTIKIGVSSFATMLSFYQSRRIISEIDNEVLMEKAGNMKALDSCKIFFYHSLQNKPIMPELAQQQS